MTPEEKLKELGYELQEPNPYPPAMVAGKIVGNLLYLSGATPPNRFGTTWKGRVGETYTVEQGYQAAREVAVVQLEMAKHAVQRAREYRPLAFLSHLTYRIDKQIAEAKRDVDRRVAVPATL